jgi:NMT1-like family
MRFFSRLMTVLIVSFGVCDASLAQSSRTQNSSAAPSEQQIRDRVNAGTVGLAGGLLEGAPIRFATEIARVVNESNQVHVLPIVTRGPTENVNDLLYLKGVDLAIINTDSLEEYKTQVPQIQQRIVSIINLFPSELHIFVRPEIKSLADLAGKKVNFNTQGTAASYSGPLIFSRLGVAVEKMFIPHPVALEQLKRGEIAAVVFITTKPVDPFVKMKWDDGFKFLPVPFGPKFSDYYVASSLEPTDYPGLIAKGESVATIAVPTVLASFNWKPENPRYRRVERFVEEFFVRVEKLKAPGFDPKWKDMDLKKSVPGMERFRAAQNWIDRAKPVKQSEISR